MTIPFRRLAMAAIMTTTILSPLSAGADEITAQKLVTTAAEDTISTFAGKTLAKDEQARLFRAEILRFSDPQLMAEDILGRYWGRMSEAEKRQFEGLLVDYVVALWSDSLNDLAANTKVNVRNVETFGDRSIVHAVVSDTADTPSLVDMTVATNGGGAPVITDIAADGISVVKTLKADFTAVLRANGGQPEALFQAMKNKMSAAQR